MATTKGAIHAIVHFTNAS